MITKKKQKQIAKALGMLFLWLFVIGIIFFLVLFIYIELTLPAPESIAARKVTESTKIYDKTGNVLLYDIHGEEKRTIISWDQIPESIKKATLASEDADFYKHKGLDNHKSHIKRCPGFKPFSRWLNHNPTTSQTNAFGQ